ncbi:MAG TPA: SDR family oxidoreductase [Thermoanaerobaculia bacterium]|jgi:NADP-dependent 3-hydroxy acid dehydrogenase YdfG|nr:SDR family oxidoreductase [Thermoanaerobaculia bacterium]
MAHQPRNIVITGASSGIGAAMARRLGRDGNRIVLAARRAEALEAVAAESGAGAVAVVADVTRRGDVERLRKEALRALGSVEVWINNAGRGISRRVLDLTDEDFDQMMTVNVKSALYGMQAIVPYFLERGRGHLINISSFLGRVPIAAHRSAYNAAKAALNALTANLRADVAPSGVEVSLVMPGLVSTDFARNAIGTAAPTAPPWTPGAPPMQPQTAEEVADAVAALIERPRAELFTNPASPELARRYFEALA